MYLQYYLYLHDAQLAKIKQCLGCDSLNCNTTLGCEIELELNCVMNYENLVKTIEYLYERVEQLEKALDKASQLLQDNGFEEASKEIDCDAEL